MAATPDPARSSRSSRRSSLDVFVACSPRSTPRRRRSTSTRGSARPCCGFTSMERAGLFLYEPGRHDVGARRRVGVDSATSPHVHATLAEHPDGQAGAARGPRDLGLRRLEKHVPARYAKFAEAHDATCTPVAPAAPATACSSPTAAAAVRARRPRARRAWTLGKLAAPSRPRASPRRTRSAPPPRPTASTSPARSTSGVLQRLFGVSLALSAERPLGRRSAQARATELEERVGDLRSRSSARSRRAAGASTTLRHELDRTARAPPTCRCT